MFFRLFERLFVIVLVLTSMHVVTGLTSPYLSEGDPEMVSTDLHMSTVATAASLSACGALLVAMRWRQVYSAVRSVWRLVGLTALAPLSIAWSTQPTLTFRRSVLLLLYTVLAIYMGERYSMDKLVRLLAQSLCLMMVAVIVFYFVAPAYVIDYSVHIGAWKGLSTHKNDFGEYMAVAVAMLLLVRFRHFAWLRYVFLVIAAVLLLLSRSATSLVCCALIIAAMPLWLLVRRKGKQWLPVYTVAALAFLLGIYLISGNTGLLFDILGRDSTLTGRTQLWAMVLPALVKHPILGYGYDVFWTGLKGESLNVLTGTAWLAGAADNGYLDLCLGLGILGLCVFMYVFAHSFRSAIDYVRSQPGPMGLFPVTYLCFFLLHNVCESTLLTKGTFPFLVFVIVTTSVSVNRRREKPLHRVPETQQPPPPVGD